MKRCIFLVVLILFTKLSLLAQNKAKVFIAGDSTQISIIQKAPVALPPFTNVVFISRLPFFCKQEYKLDKVSPIPIRFRLGSVEQANKLEGK